MSSSEIDSKTLLICWVNPRIAEIACEMSLATHTPEYFQKELASLSGRPGRGRLWIHSAFPEIDVSEAFASPSINQSLIEHLCTLGGVVIRSEDRMLLAPFGLITDQQLNIFTRGIYVSE